MKISHLKAGAVALMSLATLVWLQTPESSSREEIISEVVPLAEVNLELLKGNGKRLFYPVDPTGDPLPIISNTDVLTEKM